MWYLNRVRAISLALDSKSSSVKTEKIKTTFRGGKINNDNETNRTENRNNRRIFDFRLDYFCYKLLLRTWINRRCVDAGVDHQHSAGKSGENRRYPHFAVDRVFVLKLMILVAVVVVASIATGIQARVWNCGELFVRDRFLLLTNRSVAAVCAHTHAHVKFIDFVSVSMCVCVYIPKDLYFMHNNTYIHAQMRRPRETRNTRADGHSCYYYNFGRRRRVGLFCYSYTI